MQVNAKTYFALVMQWYMKRVLYLFWVLVSGSSLVFGQQLGVNRNSIKWRQINTDASRIIFPDGQDSIANRIATLTAVLAERHRGTVGNKLKKVDIVVQTENTQSNGYVSLGPWRSELYMTPPQDPFRLGANNWTDLLAIHEFRHAQQYANYNVGLSKVGTILGGQYGRAVANNMAIPNWFWEGDAVWNETVHSAQGRGRVPLFYNEYKVLDLAGKQYSWMKLRNGSLKNFVPDHYILGYLMVNYGRAKYGDSVWNRITNEAASFKGLFYPMQKAVERNLGKGYKEFTDEALKFYAEQWKGKSEPEKWITTGQKNNVVNYKYPYPAEDGGIIALKTSYRQIPVFVKRNKEGAETKIRVKDIGYDDYYSYRNDRIVYSAYQPDTRWANREYSVIRVIDLIFGVQKTIGTKTRYFSPDITFDGKRIVAVDITPGRDAELHIISEEGEVLAKGKYESGLILSHPKWLDEGKTVVAAARRTDGQMGWLKWSVDDNQFSWLLSPGERLVGFPVVQGDSMVYTHSANGKDALYVIFLNNGQTRELATQALGIYQGFISEGKLLGSLLTADGYKLAYLNQEGSTSVSPDKDQMPFLFDPAKKSGSENLSIIETQKFANEKYRKTFKLFNFHSWIPELNEPDYRLTFVGENVLSTLNSELFVNYNTNESSTQAGARFTFGDTYIMPFVNIHNTWSREIRLNADTLLTFNEGEIGAGLLLPLNLSGGLYSRRLNISSAVNYENVQWTGLAKSLVNNSDVTALINRITYVGQIQKARQHIYPRFGQTLILDYRTLISNRTANQFLISGSLYFPGFHVNHNIVLTGAYQGRDTLRQYFFTNSFPFSRGYNVINYPRQWRFGVNYHFPLFYPDWGFGNIVFFQRIRANAFYDYTIGKSLRTGLTTPFRTAGGEIYFDTKWWNVQAVSFGFRYSYLLDFDLIEPNRIGLFEFVLPVNLFGR